MRAHSPNTRSVYAACPTLHGLPTPGALTNESGGSLEAFRPTRRPYNDFPFAACPLSRNVFGSSPSPQILNDPKSLYHGPSGPLAPIRAITSICKDPRRISADPLPDRRDARVESVEGRSTESSPSITECHPRKFFLQALPLSRVARFGKSIYERKETVLLGFSRLQTDRDQVYEHAIRACLAALGQRAHTSSDACRH